MMPKIAALQMCSTHVVKDNLITAAHLISEAAKNNAQLAVLPEMFAIIGETDTDKVAVKEIFQQGHIQSFLSEQAKKNKIWIVGGTIPIACENKNKVRAACLVFDDQGQCVARYDKTHLFDVKVPDADTYKESDTIEAGDQIIVIPSPVGKLGLAVCYDIRFPELFRCLVNQGAEIFCLPSAFTVKTGNAHWELLTRSRAIENFCYLVGACQGGMHSNHRRTYGHSLIVDPWGTVIAAKPDDKPGVIYATIDLDFLHSIRKSVPALKHQKLFSTIIQ